MTDGDAATRDRADARARGARRGGAPAAPGGPNGAGGDADPSEFPSRLGREVGGRKLTDARILAVDDDEPNLTLFRRVLEPAGFENVVTTTDPHELLELCREEPPDLVVTDMLMPEMTGLELIERLQEELEEFAYLPVLVLTSDTSRETMREALSGGARDYLIKPMSPTEVRLRVTNLLQTRFLQLTLRSWGDRLEEKVEERTEELERARIETLEKLALAAEYRDDETGEHTRRVGRLSAEIARAMELDPGRVRALRRAGPLHDLGKIGIPDEILLKPGELTEEEFEVMRTHTRIGAQILADSRSEVLRMAEEIARCHHERWDGGGYPEGLEGEEIPLSARIVTVADVFDTLTHARIYKEAMPEEEAVEVLREDAGAALDPTVVEAFLETREA